MPPKFPQEQSTQAGSPKMAASTRVSRRSPLIGETSLIESRLHPLRQRTILILSTRIPSRQKPHMLARNMRHRASLHRATPKRREAQRRPSQQMSRLLCDESRASLKTIRSHNPLRRRLLVPRTHTISSASHPNTTRSRWMRIRTTMCP